MIPFYRKNEQTKVLGWLNNFLWFQLSIDSSLGMKANFYLTRQLQKV